MDGRGAVQGYARAAVEDFLEAADRERAQLRRSIDGASDRIARANKALGMHRVMLTMLIDTGREIADVRAAADSRAAEIVLAAQAPAQASTPAAVRDEAASIFEPKSTANERCRRRRRTTCSWLPREATARTWTQTPISDS